VSLECPAARKLRWTRQVRFEADALAEERHVKTGIAILVGLLAACSGPNTASPSATGLSAVSAAPTDGAPEPTAESPTPQPSGVAGPVACPQGVLCPGRIGPGEYAAALGPAGITFTVQSEWDADIHPEAGFVSLFHAGDVKAILGASLVPDKVFTDPCDDQTTEPLARTPEALIEWLAEHPAVEMGDPEPVTAGEATGLRVELTTTKDAPCSATSGVAPELILFWPQGEHGVFLTADGTTAIFYVLSVGEHVVVISAETIFELEPWRAVVEPVLESIEVTSLDQAAQDTALEDCRPSFPCRVALGENAIVLGRTTISLTLEQRFTAFISGVAPSVFLHMDGPVPGAIAMFITTGEVFADPCAPEPTIQLEPTAQAVAEWLATHPELGAQGVAEASLGGLEGYRVELRPTKPEPCPAGSPDPAEVLLFALGEDFFALYDEQLAVAYVLDAGDELLVVVAEGSDRSAAFELEPVVESMEFTVD
jgi:hypothetical protein